MPTPRVASAHCGAVRADHIQAEIGEVLLGVRPGRTSDEEITLFKSLGLGAEDLCAAERVLSKGEARGRGTLVEF